MQTDFERIEDEERKLEEVAKSLAKAMKGLGTNEDALIKAVCSLKPIQRRILLTKYKAMYGQDLINELKSEISGLFLETVIALFKNPEEYEAEILKESIQSLNTDEKKIIEILCTKNADEIKTLNAAYTKLYARVLESDLKSVQGGDLGRVFKSLLSGGRPSNHGYDIEQMKQEAVALYNAGEKKLGTDEEEFIRIFCTRSFPELSSIFSIYAAQYKKDIEIVLKKELSGDFLIALATIAKATRNLPGYFAMLIRETIEGMGTREKYLLQLLVRRAHIDINRIKSEYKRLFKTTLSNDIKSDVSGDFKNVLLALVGTDY